MVRQAAAVVAAAVALATTAVAHPATTVVMPRLASLNRAMAQGVKMPTVAVAVLVLLRAVLAALQAHEAPAAAQAAMVPTHRGPALAKQ